MMSLNPLKFVVFPSLNNCSLGDVCGRCMGRASSLEDRSQALQLQAHLNGLGEP